MTQIVRILTGHTSPETAFLIEDYPMECISRCGRVALKRTSSLALWTEIGKEVGVLKK